MFKKAIQEIFNPEPSRDPKNRKTAEAILSFENLLRAELLLCTEAVDAGTKKIDPLYTVDFLTKAYRIKPIAEKATTTSLLLTATKVSLGWETLKGPQFIDFKKIDEFPQVFRSEPVNILKSFFLDDYRLPSDVSFNLKFEQHFLVMIECYRNIGELLSTHKIDIEPVVILNYRATILISTALLHRKVIKSISNEICRTTSSKITRAESAKQKKNRVIDAYNELSEKVKRWNKKSVRQKAERIEEHLNEKMGIAKGEKSYRAFDAIRKDLSETKLDIL